MLRTTFRVDHKLESFFTGGKIALLPDGNHILCCHTDGIALVNLTTGGIEKRLVGDTEHVTSFALHPNGDDVVGSSRSMQLHHWRLSSGATIKTWKSPHSAPITDMAFHPSGNLLATTSADKLVYVWDFVHSYITHRFQGHEGTVLHVYFHTSTDKFLLFSCSEDATIRCWDLQTKSCVVFSHHMSAVTGMVVFPDGNHALSVSRDKVMVLWNLLSATPIKTIPVYESLDACVLLPTSRGPIIATGGEQGRIRLWNPLAPTVALKIEHLEQFQMAKGATIQSLVHDSRTLIAVGSDHNLAVLSAENFKPERHLVGYNDEILDLRYLDSPSFDVAVATNSNLVRLYHTESGNSMLLSGHEDTVVGLDASPSLSLLATASKDHTARIYSMSSWTCVALLQGHTEAVLAVALAKKGSSAAGLFIVTAGKDRTIKSWDLTTFLHSTDKASAMATLVSSRFTIRGHDKDVNALAVAPNDSVFASASQDKTVKIWNSVNGELLGTLAGHRRGVWDVKFSPVDRAVLSASGDKTIKIWSLRDYTCLKTLEGHTSAVLRANFISHGMQVLSASADGLVKLWTLKTNTCTSTFDAHEGKIWGLAVKGDGEAMLTGGTDSVVNFWMDSTEADKEAEAAKQDELRLQEQELANSLRKKQWGKALELAFLLRHTQTLLNIFQEMFLQPDGEDLLRQMISGWPHERITACLSYGRDWTTSMRTAHTAHRVMNLIFSTFPPSFFLEDPTVKEVLYTQLPYTERHLSRLDRLLQKSYIIDYTLAAMGTLAEMNTPNSTQHVGTKRKREDKRETLASPEKEEQGTEKQLRMHTHE